MSIPTHKRNVPVTLDHAMVSRLDRIARGCRLHRSSVLSGLMAEGLESLESRFEHSPDDLRLELGAAVYALRREIARQRMWELFQKSQCSTVVARERSVVEARRQAEREVGLPAGTLDRPKPQVRPRRDHGNQDARKAAFVRPRPPAWTDGASNRQHPSRAEGQGGGFESVAIDECAPQPADPPPMRGRRHAARGSDPQQEGNAAKSEDKATRKRPPQQEAKRTAPDGTAARASGVRASHAHGDELGRYRERSGLLARERGPGRRRRWRRGTRCGTDTSGPCVSLRCLGATVLLS